MRRQSQLAGTYNHYSCNDSQCPYDARTFLLHVGGNHKYYKKTNKKKQQQLCFFKCFLMMDTPHIYLYAGLQINTRV
jgi:hypothetical protein